LGKEEGSEEGGEKGEMKIRVAIRGFASGVRQFEERIAVEEADIDQLLPALGGEARAGAGRPRTAHDRD
jgi:hypothetical protein